MPVQLIETANDYVVPAGVTLTDVVISFFEENFQGPPSVTVNGVVNGASAFSNGYGSFWKNAVFRSNGLIDIVAQPTSPDAGMLISLSWSINFVNTGTVRVHADGQARGYQAGHAHEAQPLYVKNTGDFIIDGKAGALGIVGGGAVTNSGLKAASAAAPPAAIGQAGLDGIGADSAPPSLGPPAHPLDPYDWLLGFHRAPFGVAGYRRSPSLPEASREHSFASGCAGARS